jgi:hypothetical protein
MQIIRVEVRPVELSTEQPFRMAGVPQISHIKVVFVCLETLQYRNAWGCNIAHPDLTGGNPAHPIQIYKAYAERDLGLHLTSLEYSPPSLKSHIDMKYSDKGV